MKMTMGLLMALCAGMACAAQPWLLSGRYTGDIKNGNAVDMGVTDTDGALRAELLIYKHPSCSGYVSLPITMDNDKHATGVTGDGCKIELSRIETKLGTLLRVREDQCSYYHGARCVFDMTLRLQSTEPYSPGYLEARANDSVKKFVDSFMQKANADPIPGDAQGTLIESHPSGARIVIDSEYVGNAPIRIDLEKYLPSGNYGNVFVKAMPIKTGCVATSIVFKSKRIPKRMILDTDLCPIPDNVIIDSR